MVPTTDLVLLGLLMESPLHGYEIRQVLETRFLHVVRIPPGTVYYTLKKLAQQGLVEMSTERAGNRPERQVYAITEEGRARFAELAHAALTLDERAYWVFDAALSFLPLLDRESVRAAVAAKRERLKGFRRDVDALASAFPGRWPVQLVALRRKGELVSDALGAWYDELDQLLADEPSPRRRAPVVVPSDAKGRARDAAEARAGAHRLVARAKPVARAQKKASPRAPRGGRRRRPD